jgi:hypothetical protein
MLLCCGPPGPSLGASSRLAGCDGRDAPDLLLPAGFDASPPARSTLPRSNAVRRPLKSDTSSKASQTTGSPRGDPDRHAALLMTSLGPSHTANTAPISLRGALALIRPRLGLLPARCASNGNAPLRPVFRLVQLAMRASARRDPEPDHPNGAPSTLWLLPRLEGPILFSFPSAVEFRPADHARAAGAAGAEVLALARPWPLLLNRFLPSAHPHHVCPSFAPLDRRSVPPRHSQPRTPMLTSHRLARRRMVP